MSPVQPSASVAATGLGIRYIGGYVYAYSGSLNSDGTNDVQQLLFTSGSGIIVGTINWNRNDNSNDDSLQRILLNGTQLLGFYVSGGTTAPDRNPLPIIIPPFSKVDVRFSRVGGSETIASMCSIIGRVYGAE